jgi:hypothetical protein
MLAREDRALCKGKESDAGGSTGKGVKEGEGTSDDVGEVGLGKGVGGCVGNGKRDWMARSSVGVEEEEYEALGRDDVWGEDALASSRLE